MSEELKACEDCDFPHPEIKKDTKAPGNFWIVWCPDCHKEVRDTDRDRTIAEWNEREVDIDFPQVAHDAPFAPDLAAENQRLRAEVEALREALEPFAFLEMEKEEGLADTQYVWETIYSDRVQDWFSFEEIHAARAALKGPSHDAG